MPPKTPKIKNIRPKGQKASLHGKQRGQALRLVRNADNSFGPDVIPRKRDKAPRKTTGPVSSPVAKKKGGK